MLESLKRLFARPRVARDLSLVAEWAQRQGLSFRRARDGDGFVVEGRLGERPWRLEWGVPQRVYIEGHELRLRMELDLPSGMQMLVLSRSLMDTLERQTFEEFTDDVKTHIGSKTPEEMRWLVVFPKIGMATLEGLKGRFGAVANVPENALVWLEGPLAQQLERAGHELLRDDPPFALMTLRGRMYLRMQLAAPQPAAVAAALALFETAVTQALNAVAAIGGAGGEWKSTAGSTAWQTLQPEPKPPGGTGRIG